MLIDGAAILGAAASNATMRLKTIRIFAFVLLCWVAPQSLASAAAGQSLGESDFDINKLADRLRASPVIGMLTKLALKNEVDGLLDAFRHFHAGQNDQPLAELRERFNFLLMKITSLLQDKDPRLSKDIFNAREVLWAKLADPKEFSKI